MHGQSSLLFVAGPSTKTKPSALSHGATGTIRQLTYRLTQTAYISAAAGSMKMSNELSFMIMTQTVSLYVGTRLQHCWESCRNSGFAPHETAIYQSMRLRLHLVPQPAAHCCSSIASAGETPQATSLERTLGLRAACK